MVQSSIGGGAYKDPTNSFNSACHKTSSIRAPTPLLRTDGQQSCLTDYRRMSGLKKSKLPLRNGTAPPTQHTTGQAHQFLEANIKAWMSPNAQLFKDSNQAKIIHHFYERNQTYQTPVAVDRRNMYGINSSTYEASAHPSMKASAAASFFARAAQKFNLDPTKKRRRHHQNGIYDDEREIIQFTTNFCDILRLSPPPAPPGLLRSVGRKEVYGLGKVKVMLRVTPLASQADCNSSFLVLDSRKKQVTAYDPSSCGLSTPEDRRVGVAAPKMFAFDAIFSQDDSQAEMCSNSLTEVIQAVVNGKDGCVFSYGCSKLGKTYTMIGNSDSVQELGIIPCAISWLFKLINEEKQRSGARFSVRVSAVEIARKTEELRDLLAQVASGTEHNGMSPGIYLKDDPIFETQLQNQSELRAPTIEKAAYYLDAAIASRSEYEEDENSHFLYTLHVYQYRIDKSDRNVVGGRSRLHLLDLGSCDKAANGLSLSGITNVILALFNGQKHIPFKNCLLTRVLCEVLGSVTCRAAMIAHVSPSLLNYSESLNTIQFASRIHRLRRRKTKHSGFTFNDDNDQKREENCIKSSSDPDYTSSSEQSCDTVIYIGSNGLPLSDKDLTDNEGPPCSMQKVTPLPTVTETPKYKKKEVKTLSQLPKTIGDSRLAPTNMNFHSEPFNGPSVNCLRNQSPSLNCGQFGRSITFAPSDECWVDGPRFSKSKLEARLLPQTEMWVDGPHMYGFMDVHKREMIQRWVELQSTQIQNNCGDALCNINDVLQCSDTGDEESSIHSSKNLLDATHTETCTSLDLTDENSSIACSETCFRMTSNSDVVTLEMETRITRTLSFPSLKRENNSNQGETSTAPTRDSCLQVTEDDILSACLNCFEEHPLRILSEENLASSFTDSLSLGGLGSDIDDDIDENAKCFNDTDAMTVALDSLSRFQMTSGVLLPDNVPKMEAEFLASRYIECSSILDGNEESTALTPVCNGCACKPPLSNGQSRIPVLVKTAIKRNVSSKSQDCFSPKLVFEGENERGINERHSGAVNTSPIEKMELKIDGRVSAENSSGYESMVRDSEGSGSSFSNPELTSDTSEDEEHRKSLKIKLANDVFELSSYDKEDIERIERRRVFEKKYEMKHQQVVRLRLKQQELRQELALAKSRLMLNPNEWSYDLHVEESVNESDPCFLEVLERETQILEKRVLACKSRIMIVTSFDSSCVDVTDD